MLLTNQRLDKLHACKVDFIAWGMLDGSVCGLPAAPQLNGAPNKQRRWKDDEEEDDRGAVDDKDVIGEVRLAEKPSKFMFLGLSTLHKYKEFHASFYHLQLT